MLKFARLIIFIAFSFSSAFASMPADLNTGIDGMTPISMSQAENLKKQNNVYFLDTTTKENYNLRHIPGAINVDENTTLGLLPKDKEATLVFYGQNSSSFSANDIALIAQKNGYKNLYLITEGIEGWVISGRATESSKKADKLTQKEITNFHDGIHSRLHFANNMPACRDCHSSPKVIFASKQELEKLFRDKEFVNDNCKACHKDVKKDFDMSVHSAKMTKELKEGQKLPNCTDCHAIHIADKAGVSKDLKQISEQNCGTCHEKEQKLYHRTFHGKALLLNSPGDAIRVAACFDCHGAHDVLPLDNERSRIHVDNRVKTCGECHPNSNLNFTGFIAHADHTDSRNFPELHAAYVFMTCLVIGVFAFFGLHTLLWSIKLIKTRLENPEAWKKAKEARHDDAIKVKRFSALHIIQHFFMASSFLALAFSGLPQKFYDSSWALGMIDLMGGIEMATLIHHVAAVVMFAVFFSHIAEIIIVQARKGSGFFKRLFDADSLMPRMQDFRDMKAHFMWFMGKGERPQFDRWTYWEKFDYLAVFWGMFIIGFSGLVLWFPTFFASFMPGWMINLSTLVHSDEALLATGFIFAIHFFNTHFRADRFPMDMVIFSGSLTEEEIKQERLKWYERLAKNQMLDKLKDKNEKSSSYLLIAKLAGFAMLITGLVFLFMMIYAALA
ncbi:rhodanese-like domain-containing protein [Campylobacter mucosalis]|uniref:rhodanese-like domain-containing protein n=1 Tax=Campylobacter mucosalis TaxID=202 RepID=UPI0014705F81|nr:rhodanese-like domain-containing protein [Campylobacter mucosalis]